jgi:long-chain fatty acid transport protein
MKKLLVVLCVAGFIVSLASPLMAGGIDSKTNWSVEYIRTLNRNAATDSADIAAYNPAGIMKMEDGFYGNLSVHYIDKNYTNDVGGSGQDSQEPSYVPGMFAIYKQDRWAGFFAFTITGGGGYVDFSKGNYTTEAAGALLNANFLTQPPISLPTPATITSQRMEAESFYYGFTFGGAYKINDMYSVSLGVRLSDAHREATGSLTMEHPAPLIMTHRADYEEDADGWCGIIGVNISPKDELNIGIRYESKTALDFKQKVNDDTNSLSPLVQLLPSLGVNDGDSVDRNLPALLGLGMSYQVNPKIKVDANLTYYFQKDAGWKDTTPTPRDPGDVDNGYDLGIAVEYLFNDKLKGSLGLLHTVTGIDAENMLPEAPELDADTIGAGVEYEYIPGMKLNFAIGNAFYKSESFNSTITNSKVEYEKNNFFMAFGIQYKFK